MGGKSSPPPAPDFSAIAASSTAVADIQKQVAEEQLAWAKDQFAQNKGVTDQVIGSALDTAATQKAFAQQQQQFYTGTYQPLEAKFAQQAQDFGSAARQEQEAGRAAANVSQQFEGQRAASLAQLESFGVDPSQTRAMALDANSRIAEAAAKAGSSNQARIATEAAGLGLESQAINIGRGYPGAVATTFNTSQGAGNQAVNSGLATTQVGGSTMGTAPQYFGGATQGYGTAGNILNQGYANQVAAFGAASQADAASSAGFGQGIGSLAGLGTAALIAFKDSGGYIDKTTSPTQGRAVDDVPARLTAGEFVIPKDVTDFKGAEFFHKLILKTRENAQAHGRPTSTRQAVNADQGGNQRRNYAGGGQFKAEDRSDYDFTERLPRGRHYGDVFMDRNPEGMSADRNHLRQMPVQGSWQWPEGTFAGGGAVGGNHPQGYPPRRATNMALPYGGSPAPGGSVGGGPRIPPQGLGMGPRSGALVMGNQGQLMSGSPTPGQMGMDSGGGPSALPFDQRALPVGLPRSYGNQIDDDESATALYAVAGDGMGRIPPATYSTR